MQYIETHPWRKIIARRLTLELESSAIASDNAAFEYIETEIAKLGTISTSAVQITKLQETILNLLSDESKDFRLLAHLIYTLQRSLKFEQVVLAAALLADFIELYWQISAPQKLKKRIVKMMVQRFSILKNEAYHNSLASERSEFAAHLLRLQQLFTDIYPDIIPEITQLISSNNKFGASEAKPNKNEEFTNSKQENKTEAEVKGQKAADVRQNNNSNITNIDLDNSSMQSWRNTLLKIIAIEAEKSFTQTIVFQLRRHLVWSAITAAPAAKNNITSVPSLPIEKINEYQSEISKPTFNLWQKIENTIAYAPYWFDGHHLSYLIAHQLGYLVIAKLIKNELLYFLERIPAKNMQYSDGTAFASEITLKWLQNDDNKQNVASAEYGKAITIYEEQGLTKALDYLEQITTTEPRSLFLAQALNIELLCSEGLFKLAAGQLEVLQAKVKDLNVAEWEPSFFELCQNLQRKIVQQNNG